MVTNKIFTKKALQLIDKKIKNKKLSQQDSNYLSRFVRPKLRSIEKIDAEYLLKRLDYNPKSISIERKIIQLVMDNILRVSSITLCGSAIQKNYQDYEDIDIIIATENVLPKENKKLITEKIKNLAKKENLNLDIQIYSKMAILQQYPNNPSLIYQLKDSKTIYGKLEIPKKVELSSLDLKMKLDWSEELSNYSQPCEIYYAIRNSLLVKLLLNKMVDNNLLLKNLELSIGKDLISKLKKNKVSPAEKRFVLCYLNSLNRYLNEELKNSKWEKIVIENL